jgi:hypothetical protein
MRMSVLKFQFDKLIEICCDNPFHWETNIIIKIKIDIQRDYTIYAQLKYMIYLNHLTFK